MNQVCWPVLSGGRQDPLFNCFLDLLPADALSCLLIRQKHKVLFTVAFHLLTSSSALAAKSGPGKRAGWSSVTTAPLILALLLNSAEFLLAGGLGVLLPKSQALLVLWVVKTTTKNPQETFFKRIWINGTWVVKITHLACTILLVYGGYFKIQFIICKVYFNDQQNPHASVITPAHNVEWVFIVSCLNITECHRPPIQKVGEVCMWTQHCLHGSVRICTLTLNVISIKFKINIVNYNIIY